MRSFGLSKVNKETAKSKPMTRSRSWCMQRWTVAEAGMKMQPLSVTNITWFEDHW